MPHIATSDRFQVKLISLEEMVEPDSMAYNLKRIINLMGIKKFIKKMRKGIKGIIWRLFKDFWANPTIFIENFLAENKPPLNACVCSQNTYSLPLLK